MNMIEWLRALDPGHMVGVAVFGTILVVGMIAIKTKPRPPTAKENKDRLDRETSGK